MNRVKWKERKGGKKWREREGGARERDEESTRGRDRWGSEWMRKEEDCQRERERERERERDREKDEESMRIGEGRKSSGKTDVPKLQAYNECEHPVKYKKTEKHIKLFFDNSIINLNPL